MITFFYFQYKRYWQFCASLASFGMWIGVSGLYGQLSVIDTEQGYEILDKDQKVLFYQLADKSQNGRYTRSNYIHPLYNLDGTILTEDFPEDHPHHRGIFWAWHQLVVNGTKAGDAWSLEDFRWNLRERSWQMEEDASLSVHASTLWEAILASDPSRSYRAVVEESTSIRVHPLHKKMRIIDIEIQLTPLASEILLGGSEDAKGYSGLSARIQMPEDLSFYSAQGPITPHTNAVTAAKWMLMKGSFNHQHPSGFAIIVDPSHPLPNNQWVLRQSNSMQNIAWPGAEPNQLDDPTTLKYRLIIIDKKRSKRVLRKLMKYGRL